MTCREFQEILPDMMDGAPTVEQEAHRKSCRECSSLVSDLTFISQQARLLRDIEEPSPRVWNTLEIALREEGLIRSNREGFAVVPSPARNWRLGWLAPVTAALLLSFGAADYYMASKQQTPVQVAQVSPVGTQSAADADDAQVLEAVSLRAPAMRAAYEANLQDVNAYIRDARESAEKDPGDEEAQQLLMDAYAQKNMVYEMALDRSLR
jgi:hypothetical protein